MFLLQESQDDVYLFPFPATGLQFDESWRRGVPPLGKENDKGERLQ